MKGCWALLAKDLRLFFSRAGVVALLLPLVLLAALALGGGDLSRQAYLEPFPIAVRDEDKTLMSASLVKQMGQVELFSELYNGDGVTDETLLAQGAAAVITIPKDFFYDLYTMEPVKVELALNDSMALESSLLYGVFTSVMDIIAANESVQLAVYDYCYGELDAQEEAQLWENYSAQLLRDALGRQLVFDTELSATDTTDTALSALRLCVLSVLCLFFPLAAVQAIPAERDTGILARYAAAGGSLWMVLLSKFLTGLLLTLPTLAVVLVLFCRDALLWTALVCLVTFFGAYGVLLALAVGAVDGAAAQRRGNGFLLVSLLLGGAVYPLPLLPSWTHGMARLTLPYALAVGLEDGLSPTLLWPLALGVGGLVWARFRLGRCLAMERRCRTETWHIPVAGRWPAITAWKWKAMSGGWWSVAFLCLLAVLCGTISQAATTATPDALAVAVVQEDDSQEAQALVARLEQMEGLTVSSIDAGQKASWLRWGKAEGVLTIGDGYGVALADGAALPLSYESAAAAATNQAAREIVAGQVIVQRAQMRGLRDAETHLGRGLTAAEQTELLQEMARRYDALPPLYAVTSGSGAAAAISATAPLLGGTLLLILFTMLTWGEWMARPDVVRVEQRMASVPGGRRLSYGTDLGSLWLTGGLAGAVALAALGGTPAHWAAVATFVLVMGAAVRALTRLTGFGGRVDVLAPFLALITSLAGGCFCPLDQVSPWLQRLSWFTPQGLTLQGRYGILLTAAAVLLWLGRPKQR